MTSIQGLAQAFDVIAAQFTPPITHPYRVSHSASRALTAAVDHFAGLRAMIMGPGPTDQESTSLYLRPYAPKTLFRATIENAASAVWLLAPTDANERAMRVLQMGAGEVKNREAARALTGAVGPKDQGPVSRPDT